MHFAEQLKADMDNRFRGEIDHILIRSTMGHGVYP